MKLSLSLIRLVSCLLVTAVQPLASQTAPAFGPERPVTIQLLGFDAMEPAISADGNYLFFNSINDAVTTSLHYAVRVNDSTFTYVGPLAGANQTVTPRLDAVASSDSAGRFFWTTLRDFPAQKDNCMRGVFTGSDVVNTGRLRGDFYNYSTGWVMMDAATNYGGNQLWYTNAYFGPSHSGCSGVPCAASIGLANRVNDTTFARDPQSDAILTPVNDTSYVVYAPHITKDGKELYYTRFLKSNLAAGTQICVSVRSVAGGTFSAPYVVHPSSPLVPEAVTVTTDKSTMYYHKKSGAVFKIFMRKRSVATELDVQALPLPRIFPNPAGNSCIVTVPETGQPFVLEVHSLQGTMVRTARDVQELDLTGLSAHLYIVTIRRGEFTWRLKLLKQ